jgi:hypothetical protein
MSTTFEVREKLIKIAFQDVGKMEGPENNEGAWIEKFWPATSYGPEGYDNREPYCAAAGAWWIREWLKLPEVQQAFGESFEVLDEWRPDSASVFDWPDWAEARGVPIIDPYASLRCGDICIFDCSHWGVLWSDRGDNCLTIEANTGPMGERDGNGCYLKIRNRCEMRCFIRMLE